MVVLVDCCSVGSSRVGALIKYKVSIFLDLYFVGLSCCCVRHGRLIVVGCRNNKLGFSFLKTFFGCIVFCSAVVVLYCGGEG
jgi:hypothetical protein